MNVRRWRYERGYTTGWTVSVMFSRVQFRACLMRHAYGVGVSDRWVLQPSLTYDRRNVRLSPAHGEGT